MLSDHVKALCKQAQSEELDFDLQDSQVADWRAGSQTSTSSSIYCPLNQGFCLPGLVACWYEFAPDHVIVEDAQEC